MKLIFNFHQSGIIPFQRKGKELKILLITTRRNKKWTIPKGFVDPNLSPLESAKKESFEEAGITHYKEDFPLGELLIHKKIGSIKLDMFAGQVDSLVDVYPEYGVRKREWFTLTDAAEIISNKEIAKLLLSLKNLPH